jgi:hypothetical protein
VDAHAPQDTFLLSLSLKKANTMNYVSKLNDFINLLTDWDITHQYSDDMRVYKAGLAHYTKMLGIYNSLNQLDKETAKLIANMHVEMNIVPEQQAQYFWK